MLLILKGERNEAETVADWLSQGGRGEGELDEAVFVAVFKKWDERLSREVGLYVLRDEVVAVGLEIMGASTEEDVEENGDFQEVTRSTWK